MLTNLFRGQYVHDVVIYQHTSGDCTLRAACSARGVYYKRALVSRAAVQAALYGLCRSRGILATGCRGNRLFELSLYRTSFPAEKGKNSADDEWLHWLGP